MRFMEKRIRIIADYIKTGGVESGMKRQRQEANRSDKQDEAIYLSIGRAITCEYQISPRGLSSRGRFSRTEVISGQNPRLNYHVYSIFTHANIRTSTIPAQCYRFDR